jgi:flagellar basal-body rod protein FlgB
MSLPGNITVDAVGLALDMAQLRAEVASHNVARANMPGANVERADFGSALSLLQRVADGDDVDPRSLANTQMHAVTTAHADTFDGNVSLDQEVTEMALAGGHYQALTEALSRQFGLMSLALSGDQG